MLSHEYLMPRFQAKYSLMNPEADFKADGDSYEDPVVNAAWKQFEHEDWVFNMKMMGPNANHPFPWRSAIEKGRRV